MPLAPLPSYILKGGAPRLPKSPYRVKMLAESQLEIKFQCVTLGEVNSILTGVELRRFCGCCKIQDSAQRNKKETVRCNYR